MYCNAQFHKTFAVSGPRGRFPGAFRMTTVLSMSSQVVRGHVGNSAAVYALQCQGFEVWPVPTIVLSNHPGHGTAAGTRMPADTIANMLETLGALDRMREIDAVLTGYFADADQVAIAAEAIAGLRSERPDIVYLCDPVLGDTGKGLYVDPAVAAAVRDRLVPLADIVTPNLFELGFLAGRPVERRDEAVFAARRLDPATVVVTSAPSAPGTVATLLVAADEVCEHDSTRLENVPNGTGDLMAALVLAASLRGLGHTALLAAAGRALDHVVGASVAAGSDELRLIGESDALRIAPGREFVAGVDGCPGGWLAVIAEAGRFATARVELLERFEDVLDLPEAPRTIAVDIPIGLADVTGPGGRRCDAETRKRLGPRQSSVFSIPARAAVFAETYDEARRQALANSNPPRSVARQAFAIFPKIREMDLFMTPALQNRIFECHPELSFRELNGGAPMSLPKHVKSAASRPGLDQRCELLERVGFDPGLLRHNPWPRKLVGPDDVVDACVLAWSAARIHAGRHIRLPADPPVDARGLRMEINA